MWDRHRYEGAFETISVRLQTRSGNVAINSLPLRLVILLNADGIRPDTNEPYEPGVYHVRYSQAGTASSSVNRVLFWTEHPPGTAATGVGGVTPAQVDAKIAAHSALASAHHVPAANEGIGAGSVVDVVDGRLPAPAVAFRIGWSQTQTAAASIFTRAGDHPDGRGRL